MIDLVWDVFIMAVKGAKLQPRRAGLWHIHNSLCYCITLLVGICHNWLERSIDPASI